MTAKTSELLAQELDKLGLGPMARRARDDKYHDFLSDDAFCSITLERDLRHARDTCGDESLAAKIEGLRKRHLNGDFDASNEESDDWANSEAGQEAIMSIIRGDKLPGDDTMQKTEQMMVEAAKAIDAIFNPGLSGSDRTNGFVLIAFPFDAGQTQCNFVTNGIAGTDLQKMLSGLLNRISTKGNA